MNIINVGYDSSNYYVIEQNRQHLIIDVGFPGTLGKLSANLKRKGIALADIGWLCVTHYHPDHAGLVQELKDKGVRHLLLEQQLAGIPLLKSYVKADSGYVDITIQDSLVITEAQSRAWLAGIGLSGEIVSTPGHSADSLSVVLDQGCAFTGDLLPLEMFNSDQVETARRSWARLRQLNVRTVFPGHGPTRSLAQEFG
jgi:ribonuclease/clavin/mitogillin